MTTQDTLCELARQVRQGTLDILNNAPQDWLTVAPSGTSNHLLWHAGHALWLQDVLCIQLLTGNCELPADWEMTFGMNCRPVAQTTDWPSRRTLAELLNRQLERVLALLGSAKDEQLSRPADRKRGPASIAARIIHGWHDEARHCGEMYLICKLCRANAT